MNLGAQLCSESLGDFSAILPLPRLPAQQPKTRSTFGVRNRYIVLGSICYAGIKIKSFFLIESNFCKAIQVNAKLIDFEFYLKIEHMLQYLREVRQISAFNEGILSTILT